VLQHPSERRHALNTARIAALGLSSADLMVGETFPTLCTDLQNSGRRPVLLFPGEGAHDLAATPPLCADDLLLVVPDGTWKKARKLLYMNPCLMALPRVVLPENLPTRYRLRKAPMAGAISTVEAIVTALNILESPSRFDELLVAFEQLIDEQINAMGQATFERNHLR
jgi:DTW domain-containing protein YfiP